MNAPDYSNARNQDRWHTVTIDPNGYGYLFECTAPESGYCRTLPACQIDGPCRDCEGQHPPETCPGDMTPIDTGSCVIGQWIENTNDAGLGELRIAVTTEWQGDCWTWTPAYGSKVLKP